MGVSEAIDEASEAVSEWRIEQLAARGLQDVEPEGRFVLLCWDVLRAAEFRFNEASLLGKAVGMDVDQLIAAGLVEKEGDKAGCSSGPAPSRARAGTRGVQETLFGPVAAGKKRKKEDVLKVHPNDPGFRTALDGCHALALRYLEAGGGNAGLGADKISCPPANWKPDSAVARLMEAFVKAAPRFYGKKRASNQQQPSSPNSASGMRCFTRYLALHLRTGPRKLRPKPYYR